MPGTFRAIGPQICLHQDVQLRHMGLVSNKAHLALTHVKLKLDTLRTSHHLVANALHIPPNLGIVGARHPRVACFVYVLIWFHAKFTMCVYPLSTWPEHSRVLPSSSLTCSLRSLAFACARKGSVLSIPSSAFFPFLKLGFVRDACGSSHAYTSTVFVVWLVEEVVLPLLPSV